MERFVTNIGSNNIWKKFGIAMDMKCKVVIMHIIRINIGKSWLWLNWVKEDEIGIISFHQNIMERIRK